MPSRIRALATAAPLVLSCLVFACNEQPRVSTSSVNPGTGGTGTGSGATSGAGTGGVGGQGPIGADGGGIKLPDVGPVAGNSGTNDGGESPDAPACGLENFKLEKVPPEILLVLDRSSSMNRTPVGSPAGATLWTDALAAVKDVLTVTESAVNWGLKLFPLPTGCMVADGSEVEVAPKNGTAVFTKAMTTGLNSPFGGGSTGTPTDTAMTKATAYLTARNALNKNPKYIVLATDGLPTCVNGAAADGKVAAVAAVGAAAAAGFKTYVIGIAIDDGVATLNEMAVAGGVPRTDPVTKYYAAANKADLSAALNVITGQVSNCIFPLSKAPPDPQSVKVTVNGARVPPSPTEGWSYTSAQNMAIQLNGSWCEMVKTNASDVGIVFGCPNIPIP